MSKLDDILECPPFDEIGTANTKDDIKNLVMEILLVEYTELVSKNMLPFVSGEVGAFELKQALDKKVEAL